jgi:hypothetical protein
MKLLLSTAEIYQVAKQYLILFLLGSQNGVCHFCTLCSFKAIKNTNL